MKFGSYLYLPLVIALALNFAKAAEPLALDLPWRCPQTQVSRVPTKANIKITIDAGGKVDLADVEKLLRAAKNDKNWDYFYCFTDVLEYGLSQARKPENLEYDNPAIEKVKDEIQNLVTPYAKASREAGLFSAARPGKRGVPPLDAATLINYAKPEFNFFYGDNANPLDHDVITQALPAYIRDESKRLSSYPGSQIELAYLYKNIADGYKFKLEMLLPSPEQCKKNYRGCEQRKSDVAKALNLLFSQPGLAPDIPPLQDKDGRPCLVTKNNVETIITLSDQVSRVGACTPMATGDKMDFIGDPGTGFDVQYQIERGPDKQGKPVYHLRFPVQFEDPDGKPNSSLQNDFREKANSCFSEEASALRGPAGEYLELEIINSQNSYVNNDIKVNPSQTRSDSNDWNPDLACDAMMHETLHLAGLVDEYRETSTGMLTDPRTGKSSWVEDGASRAAYDCRTLGPENSIMTNHLQAFEDSRSTHQLTTCVLPEDPARKSIVKQYISASETLWAIQKKPNPNSKALNEAAEKRSALKAHLKEMDEKRSEEFRAMIQGLSLDQQFTQCPLGLVKNISTAQTNTPVKIGVADLKHQQLVITDEELPPKKPSLLYPAQFRALISPGCVKENYLYYACARNAYLSSFDPEGSSSQTCPAPTFDACKKGGETWMQ